MTGRQGKGCKTNHDSGLSMLQNMNYLQAVAFKSSAYDPVTNWNDCEKKLKEVEIQKESGYRQQDFAEAALRLNKPENAKTNDPE